MRPRARTRTLEVLDARAALPLCLYCSRQAWKAQIEAAPFVDNWHIRKSHLRSSHKKAITRGDIENLLNQHSARPTRRIQIVSRVLADLGDGASDPSIRWFFASYDQRLSTRDSVKCRALISSRWFQQRWGDRFSLANDQNQKTYYETVAGGYRLATSVSWSRNEGTSGSHRHRRSARSEGCGV